MLEIGEDTAVNITHAVSGFILCKTIGTTVNMPRVIVNSIVIAEMTVVMSVEMIIEEISIEMVIVGIKEMTNRTMITTAAAITR
jgi:hypothetical protein